MWRRKDAPHRHARTKAADRNTKSRLGGAEGRLTKRAKSDMLEKHMAEMELVKATRRGMGDELTGEHEQSSSQPVSAVKKRAVQRRRQWERFATNAVAARFDKLVKTFGGQRTAVGTPWEENRVMYNTGSSDLLVPLVTPDDPLNCHVYFDSQSSTYVVNGSTFQHP